MKITPEQVRQLGLLSRLELTDDEVKTFVEQLPKIVDYVSQLQAIEAPTLVEGHTETAPLRADEARQDVDPVELLTQAPERSEEYWKVDAVFS